MKTKNKGAGAKPAPLTNKQRQDKRKAELQAAAIRDGFRNWSEALTAWKNGQYKLVESK